MTTWEAVKLISSSYLQRGWASARLMATNSLGQSPGYEGAAQNRRLSVWRGTQEHINSLLARSGHTLTARARHLTRNSPYAIKGKRSFVGNAVGAGIVPVSQVEEKSLTASQVVIERAQSAI